MHLYEDQGPIAYGACPACLPLRCGTRREPACCSRGTAWGKNRYSIAACARVRFASEVMALLTGFPEVEPEVDYGAIDEFSPSNTCRRHGRLHGMGKLPPAHHAVLAPGGAAEDQRYWRSPGRGLHQSSRELTDELSSLLASAVRRRLVADVPSAHSFREASIARRSWRYGHPVHGTREDLLDRLPPCRRQ